MPMFCIHSVRWASQDFRFTLNLGFGINPEFTNWQLVDSETSNEMCKDAYKQIHIDSYLSCGDYGFKIHDKRAYAGLVVEDLNSIASLDNKVLADVGLGEGFKASQIVHFQLSESDRLVLMNSRPRQANPRFQQANH